MFLPRSPTLYVKLQERLMFLFLSRMLEDHGKPICYEIFAKNKQKKKERSFSSSLNVLV